MSTENVLKNWFKVLVQDEDFLRRYCVLLVQALFIDVSHQAAQLTRDVFPSL